VLKNTYRLKYWVPSWITVQILGNDHLPKACFMSVIQREVPKYLSFR